LELNTGYRKYMKLFSLLLLFTVCVSAEVPEIFKGLFEEEIPVKANIGIVAPPKEIEKYISKVEAAARKNPEWFKQHSAATPPGVPLPYHENLGLTKEEYDDYIILWAKREFKATEEVILVLSKTLGDTWTLTASGGAGIISTLRYDPSKNIFRCPSGNMEPLEDIKTDENHILGAWSGKEWRFQDSGLLGITKQNFAIGKYASNDFGIIIYRSQELSSAGARIHEQSIVLRFPLGKAVKVKPQTAPPKKK
jgi:hypothetical protein